MGFTTTLPSRFQEVPVMHRAPNIFWENHFYKEGRTVFRLTTYIVQVCVSDVGGASFHLQPPKN